MECKTAKWLIDILEAIQEIDDFVQKNQIRSFPNYQQNKMLKRAVERNLEIIGEAVNRIKQNDEQTLLKIEHARSIIALRNHVIHAYDSISDENIWSILIKHLPKLREEVKNLLENRSK
ncbi:DUF86 domain-containing protein [Algoriphagus sp. oki45]|uniref:HepT-like ribonuclease domain-containing protein n=1 Tax=Algoriphagus sp. oki45 TaxID=3067294 RepID=UPI0027E76847|nr:DUF86 domain-containing protein [Algoriphagus sp. oki45]